MEYTLNTAVIIVAIVAVLMIVTFVILGIIIRKNRYSVRYLINASFLIFSAISILPLIDGIVISIFVFVFCEICMFKFFMEFKKGKNKEFSEIEKQGVITIVFKTDEIEKYVDKKFKMLSSSEREKWYIDYCNKYKFLNPYLAITIGAMIYIICLTVILFSKDLSDFSLVFYG